MGIKSVTFKDPRVNTFEFAGEKVHKDRLTPDLYLKLVGINPKFAENFIVEHEQEITTEQNGGLNEEGAGSSVGGSESKERKPSNRTQRS